MKRVEAVERVVAAAMKVVEAYRGAGGCTVTESIGQLHVAMALSRRQATQDPKGAYTRLEVHLDENYYAGARDDLREVAAGPMIVERAYWREPVAVVTGIAWLVFGICVGVAGCAIL